MGMRVLPEHSPGCWSEWTQVRYRAAAKRTRTNLSARSAGQWCRHTESCAERPGQRSRGVLCQAPSVPSAARVTECLPGRPLLGGVGGNSHPGCVFGAVLDWFNPASTGG